MFCLKVSFGIIKHLTSNFLTYFKINESVFSFNSGTKIIQFTEERHYSSNLTHTYTIRVVKENLAYNITHVSSRNLTGHAYAGSQGLLILLRSTNDTAHSWFVFTCFKQQRSVDNSKQDYRNCRDFQTAKYFRKNFNFINHRKFYGLCIFWKLSWIPGLLH